MTGISDNRLMTQPRGRGRHEIHRELQPLERWYWIAGQIAPLNVVGRLRTYGSLPNPLLQAALKALQVRHPLLRVAIWSDEAGKNPRFIPAKAQPIPLDHRIINTTGNNDQRWVKVVDEEILNHQIDWRSGPLARATVLTRQSETGEAEYDTHDLIFSLHHVVADGTTAVSLLRQWL